MSYTSKILHLTCDIVNPYKHVGWSHILDVTLFEDCFQMSVVEDDSIQDYICIVGTNNVVIGNIVTIGEPYEHWRT